MSVKYIRFLQRAFVATLVLVLTACVSSAPSSDDLARNPDDALTRASAISTGTPGLDSRRPSTISWAAPVSVVADVKDAQLALLKDNVQAAIETQIVHKGYPVVFMQGDFQMQALLVLGTNRSKDGNSLGSSELLKLGGVDPGLMGNASAPGKGSLIIELRQGRALRWRGAVQVYLLPDTDPAVVAQRIQKAVAELLLAWP